MCSKTRRYAAAMREADVAMLDAVAEWWRHQLEVDKAGMVPGGAGWNDVLAKLAVIREYQDVRARRGRGQVLVVDSVQPPQGALPVPTMYLDERLQTLGWVMRRLAFAMAARPGWVDAWRADGG